MSPITRRRVLAALGAGATAGCLADDGTTSDPTATPEQTDLPDGCPTTQNLDVEWPEDLDADTAALFVETYEAAYYRENVVEYEPESMVDSYDLAGRIVDSPTAVGDGYVVEYSGSGGVYRPRLRLTATTTDSPDGTDIVSASDIDDDTVSGLIADAAETGDATEHVEDPGETVDEYLELLASLSADFEELSEPGDSDTLSVDADGTMVGLTAQATNFHGDYWWGAKYYVDDHVVRRTADEETDPQNGELVECRTWE